MDGSTDAKNVEEASVRMAHEVVPRLDFGKDGGSINYSLSQKSIHEADGNEIDIFQVPTGRMKLKSMDDFN